MPRKTLTLGQIVGRLRQIEVLVGQGEVVALSCKEADISEPSYSRRRKEYDGLRRRRIRG